MLVIAKEQLRVSFASSTLKAKDHFLWHSCVSLYLWLTTYSLDLHRFPLSSYLRTVRQVLCTGCENVFLWMPQSFFYSEFNPYMCSTVNRTWGMNSCQQKIYSVMNE